MSIITLTTDFGYKDHFVGATKGKILSSYSEAIIIDISHDIDKFNITEAAYCIASAYHSFPKGTIHIIAVDSERILNREHIAIQWDDHFFISADNGILSHLIQRKVPQKIVKITIHDRLHENASDMDVFVTVACHIARGGLLNVIGKEIETVSISSELMPQVVNNGAIIRGNIIYIDDFGNCVTNISQKMIREISRGRNFQIQFFNRTITKINQFYGDFNAKDKESLKFLEGKELALFNENGFLEIAIYKSNPKTVGSATTLLGLKYRDVVSVLFEN